MIIMTNFYLIALITFSMADILLATTRASSSGSPLKITLPKEVAGKLQVSKKDHVGFYEVDGEIAVRKII